MPYEDEHRRGFDSRVLHEVCYHGDPRTEVVLHRILRGQERLSVGAERTIIFSRLSFTLKFSWKSL
jgi:hypothetical protein